MNLNTKTRLANIFTALVSVLAICQTFLTHPPFSEHLVVIGSAVLTYVIMALTTWKQYLSPEISNNGATVTIWIAVIATVTGLADLFNVFSFSETTSIYIKLAISVAVSIINILSKQLFPSLLQKNKMKELKVQE
jgi:hypothetical protein